nr:MAG: cytochrome c [Hyphomicrobiales bacterium]
MIMRSFNRFVGVSLLTASTILYVSSAFAADTDAGRQAFLTYGCYTCHGYEGQGANTGPKLAPNPLPYEALATFVRQSSGDMPPYTPATLPDATLRDIYAYLQARAEPPDPASIPLLQSIQ